MKLTKNSTGQACFIDHSKAFDTINQILQQKLEAYGNETFRILPSKSIGICHINDKSPSEKAIECGIPQGSVLGPYLFLL